MTTVDVITDFLFIYKT